MLANRQVMAWTSAPAYTSLSWLTTGRHRVWTLIRLFPTDELITVLFSRSLKKNPFSLKPNCVTMKMSHSCVYLYSTCRAEQPGSRPETSLPESLRLTSGQQRQSLGSHWPGTAGQWSAQRSYRETCGWINLKRKKARTKLMFDTETLKRAWSYI